MQLDEKTLVREKVNAVLTRSKPRDFYDLYFILRSRLALREVFGKDPSVKRKLSQLVAKEDRNLKNELKRFLPVSQQSLLRDFKNILMKEIERTLP